MFIVSCPVEFFSPSGATSDVPRCRSLRSLGDLFLRNYKHFAPLGLRPQNPLVPEILNQLQSRIVTGLRDSSPLLFASEVKTARNRMVGQVPNLSYPVVGRTGWEPVLPFSKGQFASFGIM